MPRTPPRHLATITLAVSLDGASDDAARDAIRSVIAQKYPHLDLVLCRACESDPPAVLAEFSHCVDRVVCATGGGFAAVAKAFESSTADVLAWIDAGEQLEPGRCCVPARPSATTPASRRSTSKTRPQREGWRIPPPPRPRLDVYALLASDGMPNVTAFFRRREYQLLGPLDVAKRSAAGWDLLIRFARRYGLRRGLGMGRVDFHATFPLARYSGRSERIQRPPASGRG